MKLSSICVMLAAGAFSCVAFAQAPAGAPAGSTGLCKDGSYTDAASKSGACKGHKGVKDWYAADTKAAAKAAPDAKAGAKAAAPAAPAKSATPAAAPATPAAASAAKPAAAPTPAPAQNRRAQLSSSKQGSNMLTEAYKDNAVVAPAGIEASQLTKRQRQLLLAVVKSYADQYRQELSAERLREVEEHLNQTSFAWIGQNAVEAPIYYRIFSPVVLIEFDQQRAVSLPGDPNTPLRTHVHTIVRTPNGNDYGFDLLRQHYRTSPHHHLGEGDHHHHHGDGNHHHHHR